MAKARGGAFRLPAFALFSCSSSSPGPWGRAETAHQGKERPSSFSSPSLTQTIRAHRGGSRVPQRRSSLVLCFMCTCVYVLIPSPPLIPPPAPSFSAGCRTFGFEICEFPFYQRSAFVSFVLDSACRYHSGCVLLCLTYLTSYDHLWVRPHCCRWRYSFLFSG